MAEKGEAFSWTDFAPCGGFETGSGLYIRDPIDEIFSVSMGGGRTVQEEPLYIYLNGGEEFIDLRYEDPDAFLCRHQAVLRGAAERRGTGPLARRKHGRTVRCPSANISGGWWTWGSMPGSPRRTWTPRTLAPGYLPVPGGEGGNRFRLHDEEPPGGAAVLTLQEMGGREVSDFLPSESGEAVAPPHADLFAAQMF